MGSIYKIVNDINGKVYIGQTHGTVESRWKSHLNAAKTENNKHGCRYLINAINHYGAEHFSVIEIEKCDDEDLNDRERHWISYYHSYEEEHGYNLTLGGDCGYWKDYSDVYTLWDEGLPVSEIQNRTGFSRTTLSKVLKEYDNYSRTESEHRQSYLVSKHQYRPVVQYAQDGTYLNRFDTPQDAINHLGVGIYSELVKKCKQPNRMYYGYQWRFDGDSPPGPFVKRKDLYKPVVQYDMDGNKVAQFESIMTASQTTGTTYQGIQGCCSGRQKQSGGYIWRYAS